jgi:hypothetical protein
MKNSVRHIAIRLQYGVVFARFKHSTERVMYGSTVFLVVAFVKASVKAENFANKHTGIEKYRVRIKINYSNPNRCFLGLLSLSMSLF